MTMREALRSRLGLAPIDAEGRQLFLPWRPFSRAGYVVPSAERGDAIGRGLVRWVLGWLAVVFVVAVITRPHLWPSAALLVTAALAFVHYAWLTRRLTRGLERVRYEPPRG
jgi:hypothetical protein